MFGRVGQRPSFTDEFLKEPLLGSRFMSFFGIDCCSPPLPEAGPLHQHKGKPGPTHPEQPLVQGWGLVGLWVISSGWVMVDSKDGTSIFQYLFILQSLGSKLAISSVVHWSCIEGCSALLPNPCFNI